MLPTLQITAGGKYRWDGILNRYTVALIYRNRSTVPSLQYCLEKWPNARRDLAAR